jgi:hypothetical protein
LLVRRAGQVKELDASWVRRQKHEFVNAIRVLHREGLCDKSAHRPAQHTHALDAKDLDYLRGIIGKLRDIE